ncbi:hypothetical protein [Sporolactobacillus sp. KGMB 08714]|uniref:hypothetical protein n=1 Tax=Sporolactobacillus sp. KGMB 08714 TaxID=3064704 RepID=UPI002FBD7BF1
MSSVKVANQVLSHRVRVKCHTDIHGQSSLADGLFGTVQRPFVHPQAAHWQQDHWGEKPIELNPLESIMNKALSQIKNHAMYFSI